MGGGIAANLVKAGFTVSGYDPKNEARDKFAEAGGQTAESWEKIISDCETILLCVEGKISIKICEDLLLPGMREGQVLIDHSTVPAPDTRRLSGLFESMWVKCLDAPISGGAGGAASGTLRIFVGGDYGLYLECRPMFEAAGRADKINHYGPAGMGQVAKAVQQLTQRWPDMARLEVMAFGARSGLDKEGLMSALDVNPDSDDGYAVMYRNVEQDNKEQMAGLYSEWAYILKQAGSVGMCMPMLEGLYEFAKKGEINVPDPLGRLMPCIWDELMKYNTGT